MSVNATVLLFFEGEPYRVPLDIVRRHPDGDSLILPYAGQDLTRAFHAAGHSGEARRLLRRFRVSALTAYDGVKGDSCPLSRQAVVGAAARETGDQGVLWSRLVTCVAAVSALTAAASLCLRTACR